MFIIHTKQTVRNKHGKGSHNFLHTFSMALYHKWDVKNGFAYVLQFFSLIFDSLGGVVQLRYNGAIVFQEMHFTLPRFHDKLINLVNSQSQFLLKFKSHYFVISQILRHCCTCTLQYLIMSVWTSFDWELCFFSKKK